MHYLLQYIEPPTIYLVHHETTYQIHESDMLIIAKS